MCIFLETKHTLAMREEETKIMNDRRVAVLMGVAFKNTMSALLWLTSDLPERPVDSRLEKEDARPSLLVPLSQAQARTDHKGAVTGAPPNVHGSRTFVVKVQLPLNRGAKPGTFDGLGMVYDEKRSFQSFVE